jgi:hypothetical protein
MASTPITTSATVGTDAGNEGYMYRLGPFHGHRQQQFAELIRGCAPRAHIQPPVTDHATPSIPAHHDVDVDFLAAWVDIDFVLQQGSAELTLTCTRSNLPNEDKAPVATLSQLTSGQQCLYIKPQEREAFMTAMGGSNETGATNPNQLVVIRKSRGLAASVLHGILQAASILHVYCRGLVGARLPYNVWMTLYVPHIVGPLYESQCHNVFDISVNAPTGTNIILWGFNMGQVPTPTLLLSLSQPQLAHTSQPLLPHSTITTHMHRFNRDDGQPIGTPQQPPPLTQRYRAANAETRVGACSCELYLPNICHCWNLHVMRPCPC